MKIHDLNLPEEEGNVVKQLIFVGEVVLSMNSGVRSQESGAMLTPDS
jgi:hypothetical protein